MHVVKSLTTRFQRNDRGIRRLLEKLGGSMQLVQCNTAG